MVKNAAKLAVYDEMSIRVKNHQALPTIRPEIDLYHEHYKEVNDAKLERVDATKVWYFLNDSYIFQIYNALSK